MVAVMVMIIIERYSKCTGPDIFYKVPREAQDTHVFNIQESLILGRKKKNCLQGRNRSHALKALHSEVRKLF